MKTILIILLAVSLCTACTHPGPIIIFYGVNIAAIAAASCFVFYMVKYAIKKPDTTTQTQIIEKGGLKQ